MYETFLIAGFGGQGVMFAGQLLAYAGMSEGREVTSIPSYGPEMRGGTAHCYVAISDKPIGSPIVKHPQIALVFNNPSFDKYEPLVTAGGILVWNASLVSSVSTRTDIIQVPVPAAAMADEIGDLRLANVVMLGATLIARPVISLDAIRRALDEHIPPHRRDMLKFNYEALNKGAEFAASLLNPA